MNLYTEAGEEIYPGELSAVKAAEYLDYNVHTSDYRYQLKVAGIPYRRLSPEIKGSHLLYKKSDLKLVKRHPFYFNSYRRVTFKRRQRIIELSQSGLNQCQIAGELGIGQATVSRVVNGRLETKCPCCGKHA